MSQELDQTLWRLVAITDADIVEEPPVSIAFAEGEMGGTTGCNTIAGPYRTFPDDDSISIGPLRSSLTACPNEELAARERAVVASIEAASRYEVTADGLELQDAEGSVLATYETLVPEVTGDWRVIGYNTGANAVRSYLAGTELTLEFADDGTLTGNTGCNNLTSTYETDEGYNVVAGQEMTIGPVAVTERACLDPEGIMEQESQFLAALGNTARWRLVGANLELRSDLGALQISLVPAG